MVESRSLNGPLVTTPLIWTILRFRPLRLAWFFILKLSLVALIILLLHLWLRRDGYYLADLWERAFGHDSFSRTDYFAIISHYLFLQVGLMEQNLKLIKFKSMLVLTTRAQPPSSSLST